ncbi:MAG TPA: hypothetical protein VFI91_03690 [Longimicrobiaceae bacterium]|nr:hypothetical protein [Longimicrobiaceae bacterium]
MPDLRRRIELQENLDRYPVDLLEEVIKARYTRRSVVALEKASRVTTMFGSKTGCDKTLIWIMGGSTATGNSGEVTLNLNKLLCISHDDEDIQGELPSITARPWFVATARGDSPALLTTVHKMEPATSPAGLISFDTEDGFPDIFQVDVTVTSWSLDGTAAPDVAFDWHCIVEGALWTYIGG